MNIRSLTFSIDTEAVSEKKLSQGTSNIAAITDEVSSSFPLRTVRINTTPIRDCASKKHPVLTERLDYMSEFSSRAGARWFCLSFDCAGASKDEIDESCETAARVISDYPNAFVNLISDNQFLSPYFARAAARAIKNISRQERSGISNFRFGISSNVGPHTPFFPYSYADKSKSFSVALETTNLALDAINQSKLRDIASVKRALVDGCSGPVADIERAIREIAIKNQVSYMGQDISLAPFPDDNISVAGLLTSFGIGRFGDSGTHFVTSVLSSALREIIAKTGTTPVGFNGVMYSLLEDKLMCKHHDLGLFDIDSLILYSTVCGCGLDMVPLPGSVRETEVASIILDVLATSARLTKPLGIRLLPIPEKKSGERTNLTLDFITNTNIPASRGGEMEPDIFEFMQESLSI